MIGGWCQDKFSSFASLRESFLHTINGTETNICFDEDGDLIDLDSDGEVLGKYNKKKMKYKEFKDCIGNKSKCG